MKKIYASIDCGSSEIKVVVGEVINNKLHVLASASRRSQGIKRGLIHEVDKVVVAIREAINEVEQILGVNVEGVIVGIPAYDIQMINSQGFTTITNEERIVDGDDIVRSLSASAYQKIAGDRELIMVIPRSFSLDGNDNIREPKGMVGLTLGVKSTLITAPKDLVYKLLFAIEKAGLRVLDIALSAYVTCEHFLTEDNRKDGCALINVGGDISTVSVFEEDEFVGIRTLNIGGENIVRDIAYIYKVSMDDARKVFHKFGVATTDYASSDEIIEAKMVSGEQVVIKHLELAQIIEARLSEIINLSKHEALSISNSVISDFYITGGITELEGMERIVKLEYGFNSDVGQVLNIGARHAKFGTCLSLIESIDRKYELRSKTTSSLTQNAQKELITQKKQRGFKIDEDSVLGKVFGFFFE